MLADAESRPPIGLRRSNGPGDSVFLFCSGAYLIQQIP